MQKLYRLLVTTACAAVTALLVLMTIAAINSHETISVGVLLDLFYVVILYFIIFAFPICFIWSAILAVPIPWLMSRMGLKGIVPYGLAGVILGALAWNSMAVLLGGGFPSIKHLVDIKFLLNIMLITSPAMSAGGIAGVLWWLMVQRYEEINA